MKRPGWIAAAWVILVLGGGFCTRAGEASAAEATFLRANAAYDEGEYAEAARLYESLLAEGYEDPRVEYNLGNAYARLGRMGPAVLHLERARRLAPGDPDIEANLAWVRSRLMDAVDTEAPSPVLARLAALQARLGPAGHARGVIVASWLAALAVGLAGFAPLRSRLRGLVRGLGTLAAAGALLTLLSWGILEARTRSEAAAVVLAPAVEVRAGPGDRHPALFTAHEGLTVTIRAQRDGWIHVVAPNGLSGWVPRKALEKV